MGLRCGFSVLSEQLLMFSRLTPVSWGGILVDVRLLDADLAVLIGQEATLVLECDEGFALGPHK